MWAATDVEPAAKQAEAEGFANHNGLADPFKPVNKGIFAFNDGLDMVLLKPVAKGYDFIFPNPVKRGVSNFYQNLKEPRVMVNSLFQGKPDRAMRALARFILNSTIGLAGFIDIAKHAGTPYEDEDFGQTLGVWGWKNNSYIMLPLLGSSNVRDTIGNVVDFFMYPVTYYPVEAVRNTLWVIQLVNYRASILDATDILDEAAGEDRYEFVREAYHQSRKNAVYDGEPPLEGLEFLEEE